MATKLVKLQDDNKDRGFLVEVEIPGEQVEEISGRDDVVEKVKATFEQIKPIIVKICKPIADSWEEVNKQMTVEKTEVEFGLSFEAGGNLYVTKAKATANLTVKLSLKPKE